MKYKFEKTGIDSYILTYTNFEGKEVKKEFKRTIELAKKLQGIPAKARIKLYNYLSEMGLKKDDLITKIELGEGKTQYDETNYRNLENEFVTEESALCANDIIENCFNMNIIDLFKDMGINIENEMSQITIEEQNQISQFTQEFMSIIKENKQEIPSSSK